MHYGHLRQKSGGVFRRPHRPEGLGLQSGDVGGEFPSGYSHLGAVDLGYGVQ